MSCLDVDNDTNLEKFNNEHTKGVWFVWFYADWCGHCQHMVPHWEELKSNNYKLLSYEVLDNIYF